MLAGQLEGGERLVGRMLAAEETQRRTVERLDAERQAIDPAWASAAKRPASTEVGLASSVISISGTVSHNVFTAAIRAATVAGSISDGVPPPKKMVSTRRSGLRGRRARNSARRALRQRSWRTPSRTWN